MLIPHRLDDWPGLIAAVRSNPRPDPSVDAGSGAGRDAIVRYIRRLGPLETVDTRRVGAALNELLEANRWAANGGRRVLLIDGPSAMGKTQCVLAAAMRDAATIWAKHGRRVGGADIIPYIYVEAGAVGRARALLKAILTFGHIPVGQRDSADDMLDRFRALAPRLGVRAVIVDDAHMLRTADRESRQLTDFLKHMITSVPVSLVFVGAGLRDSALLRQSTRGGYSAAEQISRRADILELKPWRAEDEGWSRLLASLETHLLVTRMRGVRLTSSRTSALLHRRCGGHPGMLIDWLKQAAIGAIEVGTGLTAEQLTATAPQPTCRTQ